MVCYSRTEIENMIEKYGNAIYRAAYMNVKSRAQADDIYQEVCMKLLRQKTPIGDEEHLKAWLLKATSDCCKDYWKSAWYRKVTVDQQLAKEKRETYEEETGGYLTECVQQLPYKYRTILHLYYYEEYSIREIAKLLHMKENTVSSRLSRGREKLKQIFQKGGKEYEF